jgi:hypothetical protein
VCVAAETVGNAQGGEADIATIGKPPDEVGGRFGCNPKGRHDFFRDSAPRVSLCWTRLASPPPQTSQTSAIGSAMNRLVLPGDDIGPEITVAALKVLDRAKKAASTFRARSSKRLDLYANIRPARSGPGLHKALPNLDCLIGRENTEGFYSDRNMFLGSGEFMPTEDAALSVHVLRLRSGDRSRAGNAGCARDGQPTEHDRLIAAAAAAARRVRSADPRSVFDGERGRRDPAEQQTARAHEPGIRRATPEAGFIARATLRSPELAQSRRTGGGSEHGEGET